MSSLRKRYRGAHVESSESPPISTSPVSLGGPADTPPTPQDTPANEAAPKLEEADAPPPSGTETGPAKEAASDAIKQRLAEMERAAAIERENQQPRFADEPQQKPSTEQIIASSQLPERAKTWLRQHPEYISDPSKNSTIIALHDTAKRQAGGAEWTDMYFEKMEDLLGMRPEPQRNSNGTQRPSATLRNGAPARQQYSGPAVSAPPHRDVPSMTTGRPQSFRAPMTAAEAEIARAAGVSDGEYQKQKEKMLRLKASGVIQDGR
jgi:hypothetical protein